MNPTLPAPAHVQRRQFWLIRAYYFLFLGGFSFITPFLNLFYQRQGLNGTQIGLLGMVGAIIGLVVAPLWGRWSDRLVHPRRLLQIGFLGSAICYLILSRQNIFVWMAFLVGLNAVLLSGIEPISDTMALKSGENDQQIRFGSIRLWGSVGWAALVYFAGWIIQEYGIKSAFWGYAVSVLLIIVVLDFLRPSARTRMRKAESGPATKPMDLLAKIRQDKALLGLAVALVVTWLSRAGLYQFKAIYMDELGAGESLIGLVGTVSALVEIPTMLWADKIIHKFGSHRVMLLALLFYCLDAAAILVAPKIPTFLLGGALNGIGFSFYNVALVVFLSERAPLGQTATVMALYTSTLRGAIQIMAAPLSGLFFDYFGAYWLYAIALAGTLVGLIVFRIFVSGRRSQLSLQGGS